MTRYVFTENRGTAKGLSLELMSTLIRCLRFFSLAILASIAWQLQLIRNNYSAR